MSLINLGDVADHSQRRIGTEQTDWTALGRATVACVGVLHALRTGLGRI